MAIAEEFPNAPEKLKYGGLMHDRRVARVITPGTLIDESFMDPYANNYVMAISVRPRLLADESTPSSDDQSSLPLGLAWLDLSTGHFFTQPTTLASLPAILSRVAPREVVLDSELRQHQPDTHSQLLSLLSEERHLVTYHSNSASAGPGSSMRSIEDWTPMLEGPVPSDETSAFSTDEVAAGSLVLSYVRDRLQGSATTRLLPPRRYGSGPGGNTAQVMVLDRNSMRSLEVRRTVVDGAFKGSLLHAVRRTVTKGGARLLDEWLASPSTSLEVIKGRHDLIDVFLSAEDVRDNLVLLLKRTHDVQRIVQRFTLGRGNADDLLALAATIRTTEEVVTLLQRGLLSETSEPEKHPISRLLTRISLDGPLSLARRIADSIDEDGVSEHQRSEELAAAELAELAEKVVAAADETTSTTTAATASSKPAPTPKKKRPPSTATSIREHYADDNEAWIMKPSASPELARLHGELASLRDEVSSLESTLRRDLQAPSLTLRWSPSLGHVCHVKSRDAPKLSSSEHHHLLRSVSSSRSTRTFHHPAWTALGRKLDAARAAVRAQEQRVFAGLREAVVRELVVLRRNAAVLDELDVAAGWAILARERGLVRPVMNEGSSSIVVAGRHATVEAGLAMLGQEQQQQPGRIINAAGTPPAGPARTFVANSCVLGVGPDGALARTHLITGPNMGGKSTFLRQNALVHVLAQAGCFVPAAHAELGIVDALFARVGSGAGGGADDPVRDRSTFMVEMLETAAILRAATSRSLVVMDEVGRGTSPAAGAAVAYAALRDLALRVRCRTLFATHFHRIADWAVEEGLLVLPSTPSTRNGDADGSGPGEVKGHTAPGVIEAWCTDIDEDPVTGEWMFAHRLRPGVNRRSHALRVARMAGVPEDVLRVARLRMGDEEEHDDHYTVAGPPGIGNMTAQGEGAHVQKMVSSAG